MHRSTPRLAHDGPRRRIVLGVLAGLGLVLGIFGAMFAGIVHLIKGTAAYRASLEYATHAPAVVRALGSPMEDGVIPTGGVTANGASGDARFSIRLHGPRADGRVHVVSHRAGGVWIIDHATLELHGTVVPLTPGENQP
jgi:hypothetical protein